MFNREYSDKEVKEILSSITVIIDSREQVNSHIKLWLKSKKISFAIQKLDFADYSFFVPKNIDLGIEENIYFTNELSVERKASLEELSGNFSVDRERLAREFERHIGHMILMIEDSDYKDIINNNYKTKYPSQSYIGSLHSFSLRYDVPFIFVSKENSAHFIYYTFYYWLRNKLLKK